MVMAAALSSPLKMKIISALAAIFALSGVSSFAKTLHFPNKGDTMFNITIPDDWEPEKDDDEVDDADDGRDACGVWRLRVVSSQPLRRLLLAQSRRL